MAFTLGDHVSKDDKMSCTYEPMLSSAGQDQWYAFSTSGGWSEYQTFGKPLPGTQIWLNSSAPSYPSGPDLAIGYFPIEQTPPPQQIQQDVAALDLHNLDPTPALLSQDYQGDQECFTDFNDFNVFATSDFEPWNPHSFASDVANCQSLSPLPEDPFSIPILPQNQVDLASATGPHDNLAGPSVPPLPIAAPTTIDQERFACTAGCNKTFGRAGDWRRHMGKHALPKFQCIIIGCDKRFYRKDKLKAHVRQGHKTDL